MRHSHGEAPWHGTAPRPWHGALTDGNPTALGTPTARPSR